MKKFLLSLAAVATVASTWAGSYKLVTSTSELSEGNFVIVCSEKNMVMAAQNGTYRDKVSVTITDNTISELPTTAQICTIEPNGSNYSIKMGQKYMSWSSGNACNESDDPYALSITIDNGTATIGSVASTDRKLKYNASSPRFAFYTSAQTDICIFKEEQGGLPTCKAPVFSPSGGRIFEDETISITCSTENSTIYYSLDGEKYVVYSAPIAFSEDGEYIISAYATAEGMNDSNKIEANFSYYSVIPNTITDKLICGSFIDSNGNPAVASSNGSAKAYADYTYTSEMTGISYLANMSTGMNSKSYIQLRSKNNDSGIIVTNNKNGYILKNVSVEWDTSNTGDKNIDFYGSIDGYSSIADLYDVLKAGTKLGSIALNSTSYLEIKEGEFSTIGIRSNDGAIYIQSITLEWEKVEIVTPPVEEEKEELDLVLIINKPSSADFEIAKGEVVKDENNQIEVHYWIPEYGNDFYEIFFNLTDEDNYADFNTTWNFPVAEGFSGGEVILEDTDGAYCLVTFADAGVYNLNVMVEETNKYNEFNATGTQFIHVYPHADNHFAYNTEELNSCMHEDGMFHLNRHDETNPDKAYTYHFKRVMMAEAEATKMRAPQHEGFEEYNHEAGIDINGVKELQFIAEKNGVKSLNPAVINVSEISTGIATIAAEDGEAVYFDLQGRRLQGAPEQGIYLVRTGNKVEKAVK